jgi:hypothetical protein
MDEAGFACEVADACFSGNPERCCMIFKQIAPGA